ncbi:MAG: hypothetical protein ACJ8HJ_01820 [Massilia sp.]|jgi:hypothetical protein
MINFIEGRINLGAKNIVATSDYEHLNALAEEGVIERRENGRGETYYYVESVAEDMRFGVFIRLREKRIKWLVLHWLDGPCTSKGWDGVSERLLKEEYSLLSNFVEKRVGSPPNNKKNRQHTWHVQWGQIDVNYDQRDFVVAVFMIPR